MPSRSLTTWNTTAQAQLDEIEAAHQAVGGQAPGRRYATQQINQAFAVMLSSQFQAFCRALHSEAVLFIATPLPATYLDFIHTRLVEGRKLDHGNPNPGNLGSDFRRLGLRFWEVMRGDPVSDRVVRDQRLLGDLTLWRNAIAHQDFTSGPFLARFPDKKTLQISEVRTWRKACRRLADRMDFIVAEHVEKLTGTRPW